MSTHDDMYMKIPKVVTTEGVELERLKHDVLNGYDGQLLAKGIVTSVKIEQFVKFNTDANRLRIVLSNIVENAILFSDTNKELRWLDIHGHASFSTCSINIMDNGIGMKSGSESKVFDLFFRGSKKSQGLGVGLYVVREILEKMGGSITVYSKLDIGSKFFIWLPNHIKTN